MVIPQIIKSTISTIGRTASGQVREMCGDPGVAIHGGSGLIAALDYFVHYIEPSNKINTSIVRNDAMTNQNGFDCNKMSTVSFVLARQNSASHPSNRLTFYLELLLGKGIKLNLKK